MPQAAQDRKRSLAGEEGRGRGAGHSPLAGGQALFQSPHEGEDPVVAQDHTVGQAEVEGLHPHQPGHAGLGSGQHCVKQVRELLPGFIWRAQGSGGGPSS